MVTLASINKKLKSAAADTGRATSEALIGEKLTNLIVGKRVQPSDNSPTKGDTEIINQNEDILKELRSLNETSRDILAALSPNLDDLEAQREGLKKNRLIPQMGGGAGAAAAAGGGAGSPGLGLGDVLQIGAPLAAAPLFKRLFSKRGLKLLGGLLGLSVLEKAGQTAIKEAGEQAGQTATREVVEQAGETTTKQVVKNAGQTAIKEVGEQAGERALREAATNFNAKELIRIAEKEAAEKAAREAAEDVAKKTALREAAVKTAREALANAGDPRAGKYVSQEAAQKIAAAEAAADAARQAEKEALEALARRRAALDAIQAADKQLISGIPPSVMDDIANIRIITQEGKAPVYRSSTGQYLPKNQTIAKLDAAGLTPEGLPKVATALPKLAAGSIDNLAEAAIPPAGDGAAAKAGANITGEALESTVSKKLASLGFKNLPLIGVGVSAGFGLWNLIKGDTSSAALNFGAAWADALALAAALTAPVTGGISAPAAVALNAGSITADVASVGTEVFYEVTKRPFSGSEEDKVIMKSIMEAVYAQMQAAKIERNMLRAREELQISASLMGSSRSIFEDIIQDQQSKIDRSLEGEDVFWGDESRGRSKAQYAIDKARERLAKLEETARTMAADYIEKTGDVEGAAQILNIDNSTNNSGNVTTAGGNNSYSKDVVVTTDPFNY